MVAGRRLARCAAALLLVAWVHVAARVRSASELHATSFVLDMLPPPSIRPTPLSETEPPPLPNVFLVIGVKTRVLRGLDARRAIRETWAAPATTATLGVRVVFLGCEPDLSMLKETDKVAAQQAIAAEKAAHRDLWTHELQCQDSFFTLVDKIVAFFDVAQRTFPALAYAMVVDDDVYVRLDRLVALLRSDRVPKERFYGGNVAEKKQLNPTQPIRIPESRYYLPMDTYPIAELPPFVAGAHFVLSRDVVEFVARNRRDLRGLKGLDDATIALWMLTLQIRPVILLEFQIVRSCNCTEELVSYADLGPHAIRTAHGNLVANNGFCTGFNYTQWFKQYDTIDFSDDDNTDDNGRDGDVQFNWDLEIDPVSPRLQILTTITVANQSVELQYAPALATYSSAFCNHILPLLEAKLSILVGTNFCRFHRKFLLRFLKIHDVTMPSVRPLLTLARHNLERDAIDDEANITKSILRVRVVSPIESVSLFVLVECLMVAVFPEKHIVVVRDSDERHDAQRPDIVVVVGSAETIDADRSARRFSDPNATLIVLSADGRRILTSESDPRFVVIDSADPSTTRGTRRLYLPAVSVALAGTLRYSPMALLHPVVTNEDPPQSRAFCVVGTAHENGMLNQPRDTTDQVNAIGGCAHHSPIASASQTPTDDAIDLYRRYKFTITFEDEDMANTPGFVSEGIALAFLAGSIPVYFGHSETVTQLFNPKAFIHCRRFASLQGCGDYMTEVHHSTSLYEGMRREPPITNTTAFLELFSWHPQVAEMAMQDGEEALLVGYRLRLLLHGTLSL